MRANAAGRSLVLFHALTWQAVFVQELGLLLRVNSSTLDVASRLTITLVFLYLCSLHKLVGASDAR